MTMVYGQYERPGSTSAQFLKIDISPAAAAMGGSYYSVASGATALYYNPAAIASMDKKFDVVFNKTSWFADIDHDYSAVAYNYGRYGSVGLLLTRLITDEMKVRTPMQPDGTGETFFAGSYRLGFGYAKKMTDRVNFGGTINYIFISLLVHNAISNIFLTFFSRAEEEDNGQFVVDLYHKWTSSLRDFF